MDLPETVRFLRQSGEQLEDLKVNLSRLASDWSVRSHEFRSVFLLDFYDLFEYLMARPDPPEDEQNEQRVVDRYVRVMLYHGLEEPLVFLPWYYQEYKRKMMQFFVTYEEAERRSRHWAENFREFIAKELRGRDGLLKYLKRIHSWSGVDRGEFESRLRSLLREIRHKLDNALKAVVAARSLRRFISLVERGSITSLRSVLGLGQDEVIDFKLDVTYDEAKSFLTSIRGAHRSEPSSADALTISAIGQLYERYFKRGEAIYLVSSEGTIASAARLLSKRYLAARAVPIEIRPITYWRLRFQVEARARKGGRAKEEELRTFRNEFVPKLEELTEKQRKLSTSVVQYEQDRGRPSAALEAAIQLFVQDFDGEFRRLSEPLLDPRWMASMLSDELSSLGGESEDIVVLLDELEEAASELEAEGLSVLELSSHLQVLLIRMEDLLERVANYEKCSIEREQETLKSFSEPALGEGAGLGEPYGPIICLLSRCGRSRLKWAEAQIGDSIDQEAGGLSIARAWCAFLRRDFARALEIVESIPITSDGIEREAGYVRALLSHETGDWGKTREIFGSARYSNHPVVDYLLARDCYLQWRQVRREALSADALDYCRRAWANRAGLSISLKLRIALLLSDILSDGPVIDRDRSSLRRQRNEVETLLLASEFSEVDPELRDAAQHVMDFVEALLGSASV